MSRRKQFRSGFSIRSNKIAATVVGRRFIQATGVYGVIVGSLILWGGDSRFHGPTLGVLADWASYVVWGYIPIACGLTILFASATYNWRVKFIGLAVMAGWTTAIGTGAAGAVLLLQQAGVVAGPTFFFVTFIIVGLIPLKEEPPAREIPSNRATERTNGTSSS